MRCGLPVCALALARLGMKSWKKERSEVGRNWQASRIEGSLAPTRASTNASRCDGSGQAPVIADHADAAGRAARAPAADARMWDIVAQARFQHAEALGHANRAA